MPAPTPPSGKPHLWERAVATATIAVGETASDEIDLGSLVALAIQAPAGATATELYLEHRLAADGTWSRLVRDGGDITLPVVAGKTILLEPGLLIAATRLRLVGNLAQATSPAAYVVLTGAY